MRLSGETTTEVTALTAWPTSSCVPAPETSSATGAWSAQPTSDWRMRTTAKIPSVRQKKPRVSRQLRRSPSRLPTPSTTIAWAKSVLRTASSGSEASRRG